MHSHIEKRTPDGAAADFVRLMPWGTPDQLLEKIEFVHETIGAQGMMGHFSYAGMPYDEAERSLRLFVDKVMPEMQRIGTESGALMVG